MPKTEHLILGANSYLGQHVAHALRGTDSVAHVRHRPNVLVAKTQLPIVEEDLILGYSECAEYDPKTVYIIARPAAGKLGHDATAQDYIDFTQSLRELLQTWSETGQLERVVFMSTQLVYATPPNATPVGIEAPLKPSTLYEWGKVEMEAWLAMLALNKPKMSVEIYRLPLLGGGAVFSRQCEEQYLHSWRLRYTEGYSWKITAETPNWGNSWVHVTDLAEHLVKPKSQEGFSVHQPVSGHVVYTELHEYFKRKFKVRGDVALYLPNTFFFLKDTENMPTRKLEEIYGEAPNY